MAAGEIDKERVGRDKKRDNAIDEGRRQRSTTLSILGQNNRTNRRNKNNRAKSVL